MKRLNIEHPKERMNIPHAFFDIIYLRGTLGARSIPGVLDPIPLPVRDQGPKIIP